MHELSLAEELVEECCRLAGQRKVLVVQVRCPPTVDCAELEEGFYYLARGGALEGARLEVERAAVALSCPCGFEGPLDAEDLVGHLAVCPRCGQVQPVAGGVELMAMRLGD